MSAAPVDQQRRLRSRMRLMVALYIRLRISGGTEVFSDKKVLNHLMDIRSRGPGDLFRRLYDA